MKQPELDVIAKALELMGMALVHHEHQWSTEERKAYDDAICVVFSTQLCENSLSVVQ